MSIYSDVKNVTVNTLQDMKKSNEKITCLTAYDYTSAKIIDAAGIDMILVGDSLGMVMNGYDNTLSVTIDEIIYHTKSVKRAIKRAFLIADMPFGSYGGDVDVAVSNCIRVVKESGANCVKLEGGEELTPIIQKLYKVGVCVMGHIGLKPQSVNIMGGYKVQSASESKRLIAEAKALEQAGAISLVIEGVSKDVAKDITSSISIPTIGIGAGLNCDGQVLVFHDIFGLFTDFKPKFVKRYANIAEIIANATKEYIVDVKIGHFPTDENTYR